MSDSFINCLNNGKLNQKWWKLESVKISWDVIEQLLAIAGNFLITAILSILLEPITYVMIPEQVLHSTRNSKLGLCTWLFSLQSPAITRQPRCHRLLRRGSLQSLLKYPQVFKVSSLERANKIRIKSLRDGQVSTENDEDDTRTCSRSEMSQRKLWLTVGEDCEERVKLWWTQRTDIVAWDHRMSMIAAHIGPKVPAFHERINTQLTEPSHSRCLPFSLGGWFRLSNEKSRVSEREIAYTIGWRTSELISSDCV